VINDEPRPAVRVAGHSHERALCRFAALDSPLNISQYPWRPIPINSTARPAVQWRGFGKQPRASRSRRKTPRNGLVLNALDALVG
jgi:hypothetical protein